MQKHVNLVDLVKSFPTNIYLQNLASIQQRTSPVKFAHLAEKSGKGSISNLSIKVYKLAKTEQWKIAALADAAATAVAKAFEKAKRDDEGEKVWEEENLREAIGSASASCKNHLGPSWTDWIENGHPLGLTNGQQKLSWSDMSPALDLEKLIFEAAEVANVVA